VQLAVFHHIEPMAELDDAALWLADVEGLI
jgi:hypothetical protein